MLCKSVGARSSKDSRSQCSGQVGLYFDTVLSEIDDMLISGRGQLQCCRTGNRVNVLYAVQAAEGARAKVKAKAKVVVPALVLRYGNPGTGNAQTVVRTTLLRDQPASSAMLQSLQLQSRSLCLCSLAPLARAGLPPQNRFEHRDRNRSRSRDRDRARSQDRPDRHAAYEEMRKDGIFVCCACMQ